MALSPEQNEALAGRFYEAFGRYVAATANNESVFIGFLILALGDDSDGQDASFSIWFQFQSTRARLEMVRNVVRATFGKRAPTQRVTDFIVRFKGLTRQRNYYAHAHYHPDEKTGAIEVSGYQISAARGSVVAADGRLITRGMCNEIERTIYLLEEQNLEMWKYLNRLQKQLLREGRIAKPLIDIPPLPF